MPDSKASPLPSNARGGYFVLLGRGGRNGEILDVVIKLIMQFALVARGACEAGVSTLHFRLRLDFLLYYRFYFPPPFPYLLAGDFAAKFFTQSLGESFPVTSAFFRDEHKEVAIFVTEEGLIACCSSAEELFCMAGNAPRSCYICRASFARIAKALARNARLFLRMVTNGG